MRPLCVKVAPDCVACSSCFHMVEIRVRIFLTDILLLLRISSILASADAVSNYMMACCSREYLNWSPWVVLAPPERPESLIAELRR